MKVLDASFLIDYEHGVHETIAYLETNADEEFIIPSTVYTEYLLGEANGAPKPDISAVRAEIAWASVYDVTRETADLGIEAVASLPDDAPHFDGVDATVVGVAREVGAPIVAGDSDFTHPSVREQLNITLY